MGVYQPLLALPSDDLSSDWKLTSRYITSCNGQDMADFNVALYLFRFTAIIIF